MSLLTKQDPEAIERRERFCWVEAGVWTDRMLAALENGVKGGKWFSLMDKVYAARTLQAAWKRVSGNKGAAGVDRVSVERFSSGAERYLEEVSQALCTDTYEVSPVRWGFLPGWIINGGRMHSSLSVACSLVCRRTLWRANPDVETPDWRAVCGRTARTVRRAGRV